MTIIAPYAVNAAGIKALKERDLSTIALRIGKAELQSTSQYSVRSHQVIDSPFSLKFYKLKIAAQEPAYLFCARGQQEAAHGIQRIVGGVPRHPGRKAGERALAFKFH